MLTHRHNLGNDRVASPLHTEYLCQFLEVLSCSIAYREDGVAKPAHAELTQFLIKELHTKLTG